MIVHYDDNNGPSLAGSLLFCLLGLIIHLVDSFTEFVCTRIHAREYGLGFSLFAEERGAETRARNWTTFFGCRRMSEPPFSSNWPSRNSSRQMRDEFLFVCCSRDRANCEPSIGLVGFWPLNRGRCSCSCARSLVISIGLCLGPRWAEILLQIASESAFAGRRIGETGGFYAHSAH